VRNQAGGRQRLFLDSWLRVGLAYLKRHTELGRNELKSEYECLLGKGLDRRLAST